MGRFIVILLIVGMVAWAAYAKWFTVTTTTDKLSDKSSTTITLDKAKIKDDTAGAREKLSDLGEKTKEKAKEISESVKEKSQGLTAKSTDTANATSYALSQTLLNMLPGSSAKIGVTRTGGDLTRVVQLSLSTSQGSHLLVSGGLFTAGKTESTIEIEAPANANSGTVSVVTDSGVNMDVKVTIAGAEKLTAQ